MTQDVTITRCPMTDIEGCALGGCWPGARPLTLGPIQD